MKQKIKGKNCAVFCFAAKRIFYFIYEVITWGKKAKLFTLYYSHTHIETHTHAEMNLTYNMAGKEPSFSIKRDLTVPFCLYLSPPPLPRSLPPFTLVHVPARRRPNQTQLSKRELI